MGLTYFIFTLYSNKYYNTHKTKLHEKLLHIADSMSNIVHSMIQSLFVNRYYNTGSKYYYLNNIGPLIIINDLLSAE